jgi:hypothetical protein
MEMFAADLELLKKKGADYSGEIDAMANFKDFGFFGIIVRLNDKMARLRTLTLRRNRYFNGMNVDDMDPRITDESIIDTLRDLRNYSYLAQVVYEEENKDGNAI